MGALPYMGGGNIEPWGSKSPRAQRSARSPSVQCSTMPGGCFGEKLQGLMIDAMQPGGGDPYAGPDGSRSTRGIGRTSYRLGFPARR